jgi:hypothetical protein
MFIKMRNSLIGLCLAVMPAAVSVQVAQEAVDLDVVQ